MQDNLSLETRLFEKASDLELDGVQTITFSNVLDQAAFLKFNGITRELPPAQLIGGTLVPIPFSVPSSQGFFKIKFEIKFPVKNGKVIVDYLQRKNC